MIIKEFQADVKLITTDELYYHLVDKIIVKQTDPVELKVDLENISTDSFHHSKEWMRTSSFINIIIGNNFISFHYLKKSTGYQSFTSSFLTIASSFKGTHDRGADDEPSYMGFAPISVIFITPKKEKLRFFIPSGSEDMLRDAFVGILKVCWAMLNKRSNKLIVAINNIYKQPDGIIYLKYCGSGWKVLDILAYETAKVSKSYLIDSDPRVKKPWIVFQKDNLQRCKVTNNNWVLTFDQLQTLLLQPNDVAIYSNISNQNLELANIFYKETIVPRHKHHTGAIPHNEEQQSYFEYFQLIITSIIFGYTALEAFVNICIPDDYTYEENKNGIKTIYSKAAIERTFALRDKLKKVINKVLDTPDPTQQKWWSRFIALEELRNEVIHTKQSSSEDRYSNFLSQNIFSLVKSHIEIINYYGEFINLNRPRLLEEFPYNFGYDDVLPGLTESPNYDEWMLDNKRHKRQAKALKNNNQILSIK